MRANPLSYGDSTRARSCPSDRLATHQGARSRCVRSMSATQHSTNEHPYSAAPGSSSGTCAPACTRWVAPIRTEESSVSRRPSRFGGSPGIVRGCLPLAIAPHSLFASCGDQPLTPLSRPPCSTRVRCLPRRDPARIAKIASTPEAVTRPKLSRSRMPSLGKQPATHCDHFRSPISGRDRPRDFAHRASDRRLLFAQVVPRSACWRFEASSGEEQGRARGAYAFSRGLSDVS